MSSLKDFKKIADDMMKDIEVSDELKRRTLKRLSSKKNNFLKTALIPAACVILLALSAALWQRTIKIPSNNNISINNVQNANVLKTPGNSSDASKTTISGSLNSLKEVKKFLGYSELTISYLPKSYKLASIQGVSFNNENRKSVWFQYSEGNRSFVISIEQNSTWKSFEGYDKVDINGAEGHIKTFKDGSNENTELRWFKGKDLYTVEGELTGEEALKTARSIKHY